MPACNPDSDAMQSSGPGAKTAEASIRPIGSGPARRHTARSPKVRSPDKSCSAAAGPTGGRRRPSPAHWVTGPAAATLGRQGRAPPPAPEARAHAAAAWAPARRARCKNAQLPRRRLRRSLRSSERTQLARHAGQLSAREAGSPGCGRSRAPRLPAGGRSAASLSHRNITQRYDRRMQRPTESHS